MFDLIYIFTFINRNTVEALFKSFLLNRSIKLGVVAVAQNNIRIDTAPYESEYTRIWVKTVAGQLNSSEARNVGIEYVLQHHLTSKFILFPDDDSSFDACFFENFNRVANPQYCYLTDVYETGSKSYFQHIKVKPEQQIDKSFWNNVGAVNMLVNYETFLRVGMFDENMGVAAKYGGGEDGDYFFRSLYAGAKYQYTPLLYSYHPSGKNKYKNMSYKQILKRFRNYGTGVEYLLIKHKMYKSAFYICFKALPATGLYLFTFRPKLASVYFYAFCIRLYSLITFIYSHKT
ncbi:glycosyltransferase family 2 protein [Parabacteroides sp. AM08-6]|uniref:glycosyltransferase family 2 protein n=1 Tax=Parabacteroides sp. AM08-6 TaxID=2292053 RepID=UPI000F003244|nr:hypothetical protein [Parabacteroides sp. AM08-6]RHJ85294.1 hypothetical protein DW103_03580 [Parabacteroides sp. AM08-6]